MPELRDLSIRARRSGSVPGVDRSRLRHVPPKSPPRIRSRSRRFGFETSLGPPPGPLRGRPPGSDASASAGYRHLFFLGLQQHVPFQSFVQGAVRGLTTRLPDSIPERLRNSGAKFKPPFPGRGGLANSLSAIRVSGAPTLPDRISVAPLPNCLQSLFWRTCLENTDAHQWRANPIPCESPVVSFKKAATHSLKNDTPGKIVSLGVV